jgi:hypothetical protein
VEAGKTSAKEDRVRTEKQSAREAEDAGKTEVGTILGSLHLTAMRLGLEPSGNKYGGRSARSRSERSESSEMANHYGDTFNGYLGRSRVRQG